MTPTNAAERLLTEYPLPEASARIIRRMTPFLLLAAINALLFLLLIGLQRMITGIPFLLVGSTVMGMVGHILYRALGQWVLPVSFPFFSRTPYVAFMEEAGLPPDVAFASFQQLIVIPPKEKSGETDDENSPDEARTMS